MEVGTYSHGLRHEYTEDDDWTGCNMGSGRSSNEVAHFLRIKTTYDMSRLAKEYVSEIVRLHGMPLSIISDRDPRFTSRFWQSLQVAMGTKLNFSTAFHPQTDGQSERTIQTLEDKMRAVCFRFQG